MKRRKNKKIVKTTLVLSLVLGLLFFWFSSGQNLVLAQTASLVATVRINPLEVEVTAPSPVNVGERFKVKATVKNLGGTKIKKAKVEIFLSSGLSLKGKPEQKLGMIPGGKSKTASWWVTAKEPGKYGISVKASGIEEKTGDWVEASDTASVEVQASLSFWSLIRRFLARA